MSHIKHVNCRILCVYFRKPFGFDDCQRHVSSPVTRKVECPNYQRVLKYNSKNNPCHRSHYVMSYTFINTFICKRSLEHIIIAWYVIASRKNTKDFFMQKTSSFVRGDHQLPFQFISFKSACSGQPSSWLKVLTHLQVSIHLQSVCRSAKTNWQYSYTEQ